MHKNCLEGLLRHILLDPTSEFLMHRVRGRTWEFILILLTSSGDPTLRENYSSREYSMNLQPTTVYSQIILFHLMSYIRNKNSKIHLIPYSPCILVDMHFTSTCAELPQYSYYCFKLLLEYIKNNKKCFYNYLCDGQAVGCPPPWFLLPSSSPLESGQNSNLLLANRIWPTL